MAALSTSKTLPAPSTASNRKRFLHLLALSFVFLSVSYWFSNKDCSFRSVACVSAPKEQLPKPALDGTTTPPFLDKEDLYGNETTPNEVSASEPDTADSEEGNGPPRSPFDEYIDPAIAAAASLLRSAQTRLGGLPLPTLYEYRLLSPEDANRMHQDAFVHKPASVMAMRLKRALARGFLRIPLGIAALGGSVTYGVGTDSSWANRVFSWIEDVLPRPLIRNPSQGPNGENAGTDTWTEGRHEYINGAIRASGAELPSLCFPEYIGTDLDIVLLDFHINGATIDQMHLLLSRLLNLPRLPAVVEVAVFRTRGNDRNLFPSEQGPVETDFIRVGKTTGLPIFDIWQGVKKIWKNRIPDVDSNNEASEKAKQKSEVQGSGIIKRDPGIPANRRKSKQVAQELEKKKQLAAERSYEGFYQLFYRDKIHFNNVGHNITASIVIEYFKSLVLELTETDLRDAWILRLGNQETRDRLPIEKPPLFATGMSEDIYAKERQREISLAPKPTLSKHSGITHSLYLPPPPSSPARWPVQCFSRYGPVRTGGDFTPTSVSKLKVKSEWGDWTLSNFFAGKIWWTGKHPGTWATWTVPLSKPETSLRGGEVGVGFNKGYKGGVGVTLLEVKDENGRIWVEALIDTKWSTLQHVFRLWWSGCLLPPDVQSLTLTFTIPPSAVVPDHNGRLVELLGVYWRGHPFQEVPAGGSTIPACRQRLGKGIPEWIGKHKLGVHNSFGGARPDGEYVDMTGHIDDDGAVQKGYRLLDNDVVAPVG